MEGVLQDIITIKTVTTKFGPKPIWGCVIDGATYECGFKKPRIDTGVEVEFETEFKYGKNQIIEGTLRLSGSPMTSAGTSSVSGGHAAPGASPSPGPTPTRGRGVFPIPPDSGEIAIIRQNALTNAREVLCQLGPSYFGKSKADMNTSEDTAKVIIEMAKEFEKYTTGAE